MSFEVFFWEPEQTVKQIVELPVIQHLGCQVTQLYKRYPKQHKFIHKQVKGMSICGTRYWLVSLLYNHSEYNIADSMRIPKVEHSL